MLHMNHIGELVVDGLPRAQKSDLLLYNVSACA